MKNLGEKIRELRLDHNLTQEELAKKIGVNKSAVSFWELNTNEPKASYIMALSIVFNITTDYLLGLSDSEEQDIIKSPSNAAALPEDETELLEEYRAASSEHKKNILTIAKSFAYQDKQKTNNSLKA